MSQMNSGGISPPVMSASGLVRIGFPMRIVAAFVDVVIAGIAGAIVRTITFFAFNWAVGTIAAAAISGLAGCAVVLGYFGTEIVKSQSPAKMMFKFIITAQDGSPATRDQLVKRYLFKQIPIMLQIFAFIPVVGCFIVILVLVAELGIVISTLMVLNADVLAYHDKMFGTAVYGPPPAAPVPYAPPAPAPGNAAPPPPMQTPPAAGI